MSVAVFPPKARAVTAVANNESAEVVGIMGLFWTLVTASHNDDLNQK